MHNPTPVFDPQKNGDTKLTAKLCPITMDKCKNKYKNHKSDNLLNNLTDQSEAVGMLCQRGHDMFLNKLRLYLVMTVRAFIPRCYTSQRTRIAPLFKTIR